MEPLKPEQPLVPVPQDDSAEAAAESNEELMPKAEKSEETDGGETAQAAATAARTVEAAEIAAVAAVQAATGSEGDRESDSQAAPSSEQPPELQESPPSGSVERPELQESPPSSSVEQPESPEQQERPLEKPWLPHYEPEVAESLPYPDHGIVQFLLDSANRYPNNEALYFMGRSLTYRELHKQAAALARSLVSLGIAKGDRIAIMLPNCPQAVVTFYGVLLAGAVVVQTNPLYVERELEHQLKDSGASALITLDLLYARVSRVRGEQPDAGLVPQLKHVIITSIKDGLPFPKSMLYPIKQRKDGFKPNVPYGKLGVLAYRKLVKESASSAQLPEPAAGDELAALQYTGGTTGTPKGVMLTHRNFVANTLQIAAWCHKAVEGKERFLAALPLFHVFGLTVLMNMSVYRAGSMVLLPRFEPDTALKTISDQHPTIFPGAPTMYVALINHVSSSKLDLSSINICISGSSALPLEVQEQFEALTGGRLIEGYGLTEAAPVTHANPIWGYRKIGSIGVPLPDTEAAIVNPATGERLPVGELGELVIRGPQVMSGYWNRPEETAGTIRDGWLHTGDMAKMDAEGFFVIMDRIKDIIIAGGYNIYPREVEEVLFEHPAVREAAVVGIKDDYRGETVKAFIVLKEGWQVSRGQLDRWCRDRLAAYKVPHHYTFRESLPKTMIGKVLRRRLIEEELEAEGQAEKKE